MTVVYAAISNGAAQAGAIQKHEMEMPDPTLERVFYPWGFPICVRTNEEEVLRLCEESWGGFALRWDAAPVQVEVWVVESDAKDCPQEPAHRLISGVWMTVADAENYCVVDLRHYQSRIVMARATLRHPLYAKYFLLGMPMCCVTTRYVTPIHAACVMLNGCGVLLCGESGAGKSTLAYACAREGWTYVSDDATLLRMGDGSRQVIGNCHQMRFRPSAATLFPELEEMEITPRAAGKPSVEVPTASMKGILCSETVRADYLVFLNRNWSGPAEIVPYSRDAARSEMRSVLFAPGEARLAQYEAIDRLLDRDVLELRYERLEDAMQRLRRLVREGR